MNVKNMLTVLLLVFVGASLLYMVLKEPGTSAEDNSRALSEVSKTPSHQVVVYYFHGFQRCKTCLAIESNAKEIVEAAFPKEIESNMVVWKAVNFEEEENAAMAEKYELVASSLVVVEFREGREIQWKTLDKVWELVWENELFDDYVRKEIIDYMIWGGIDG